jgi:1,4-dihydroxy-2-naphthoyl-CoA hydrolase
MTGLRIVPLLDWEISLTEISASFLLKRSLVDNAALDAPKYRTMSEQKIPDAIQMPFAELIGMKIVTSTPERVTAEMMVRPELCTNPAVLHGGALMAFADSLGAYATFLNLREGQGTTTIESKTNFLAPAPVGSKVTAECAAIHRGRRTMVWQTRITSEAGKLIGIVTQTQMVLDAPVAK